MSTMPIGTLPASAVNSLAFTLKVFLREARFEFIGLSRTRSFALSVIGFPVVFYLFFGLIMNRGEHIGSLSVAKYMLASYSVFGMVGASLFGVGVSLANELGAGWLELKRASPMPPLAYLLAKCTSAMAFGVIIVSMLTVMSITFGHVSLTLPEYGRMMALTILGVIPFACMGMALSLFIPANSAPGIVNMIYLPMSFCGGLWVAHHVPSKTSPTLCHRIADLSLGPARPWGLRLRKQRKYFKSLAGAPLFHNPDACGGRSCLPPS